MMRCKKILSLMLAMIFIATTMLSQYDTVLAKDSDNNLQENAVLNLMPNNVRNQQGSTLKNATNTNIANDNNNTLINSVSEKVYETAVNQQSNVNINLKPSLIRDVETNRFIVKYKDVKGRDNVSKKVGDKFLFSKSIKNNKLGIITTKEKKTKNDLLNELKNNNADVDIEYIQPDYEIPLLTNDMYFSNQWGIYNTESQETVQSSVYSNVYMDVGAASAWAQSQGDGVVVAVIDTGMDITHEDLAANIWTNAGEIAGNQVDDDGDGYIDDVNGWNFCDNNNQIHNPNLLSDEQHATHVAGILAAIKDNGIGIAGVAPKAKIMPLKAFKNGTAYTSDIINAIEYAEKKGVKIVNCSWGTTVDNQALKEAIEGSNMLFIFAAGNNGVNIDINPVYPAAYDLPNIISVASINKYGNLSSFSNYGVNSVNVAAPGEAIISTLPNNGYGYMSGTSMAAPFVTGDAALLLSEHNNYTAEDIRKNILLSSDNIPTLNGKVYKSNKIDCYNAVNGISNNEKIKDSGNGTVVDSVYQSIFQNSAEVNLYSDCDFNSPKKVLLGSAQVWEGFNNTQFTSIEYASISNWGGANNAICGTTTLICNNSELQFFSTLSFVDNGKAQIALGNDGRLWVAIPKGKIGNGTGYNDDITGFINYLANKGTTLVFQQSILQSVSLNKTMPWELFNNTTFSTIEFISIPNWASSSNAVSGTSALTCYNADIYFTSTLGFVDNGSPQVALGSDGRLWIAIPKGKLGGSTGYSDDLAGFKSYITDKGTILVYQQATINSVALNSTLSWQGFSNTQFTSIDFASIADWSITNNAISNTVDLACNNSDLQFVPVGCFLDNGKAQVALGNDGKLWVAIPKGKIGNGTGYSDDLNGFINYLTNTGTTLLYQRATLKTANLDSSLPWEVFNNTTFSTIEFISVPDWASSNNAVSGTTSLICKNSDLQFIPTLSFVDNASPQVALTSEGRLWIAIPKGKIGGITGYNDDLTGFKNYLSENGTKLTYHGTNSKTTSLNNSVSWQQFNNTTFSTIEYISMPNWASSNNAVSGTTALICINSDMQFVPTLGFVDNGKPQVALGVDGRLWVAIPRGILGGSTGYSDDLTGFKNYLTAKATTLTYQINTNTTDGGTNPPGTGDTGSGSGSGGSNVVTINSVTANGQSIQEMDTGIQNTATLNAEINFTVNASGASYLKYRFKIAETNGFGPAPNYPIYTSSNTFKWTPTKNGTYYIKFEVKDATKTPNENDWYDDYKSYTYNISSGGSSGADNLTWYKFEVGNKAVYIKEPEAGTSNIEARVCDNGSTTALVYSYIGGQWFNNHSYAYVPGSGGGVTVASVQESVYSATYGQTNGVVGISNFVNDIVKDVQAKVDEIKGKLLNSLGFDADSMTSEDWNMLALGMTAGIIDSTFPERNSSDLKTIVFNKNTVKALLFKVKGMNETDADTDYYYIKSKTNTEFAIMIAARTIEAGSFTAAVAALQQAGVSFTGGLATFVGSGGTAAPLLIAIEVESATALVASGVCSIAGVAAGKVADSAESALNGDVPKVTIADAIKKIKHGLRDISYTDEVIKSADEINAFWSSKNYTNPPYKAGTPVSQIKITYNTNFIKVYDGVNSFESGQFVMKLEDITNADGTFLTAQQIKDKYALDFLPKFVADAEIPAGTTMNCGIAGEIQGWGSGGGLQFDLNGAYTGNFKFRCNLPN